ncbi:hypothetical protein PR048_032821 [Dryococelus australis]|uniref:Uncharacterized protein n=1 Tax=Dryococelus australis TaxID=614101 RepID=A0ABQ9G3A2_9NEOP|nr:hypothetical protein PR048_032821 [Dryococelus australis]
MNMKQRWNKVAEETGEPPEYPRHYSHLRKTCTRPARRLEHAPTSQDPIFRAFPTKYYPAGTGKHVIVTLSLAHRDQLAWQQIEVQLKSVFKFTSQNGNKKQLLCKKRLALNEGCTRHVEIMLYYCRKHDPNYLIATESERNDTDVRLVPGVQRRRQFVKYTQPPTRQVHTRQYDRRNKYEPNYTPQAMQQPIFIVRECTAVNPRLQFSQTGHFAAHTITRNKETKCGRLRTLGITSQRKIVIKGQTSIEVGLAVILSIAPASRQPIRPPCSETSLSETPTLQERDPTPQLEGNYASLGDLAAQVADTVKVYHGELPEKMQFIGHQHDTAPCTTCITNTQVEREVGDDYLLMADALSRASFHKQGVHNSAERRRFAIQTDHTNLRYSKTMAEYILWVQKMSIALPENDFEQQITRATAGMADPRHGDVTAFDWARTHPLFTSWMGPWHGRAATTPGHYTWAGPIPVALADALLPHTPPLACPPTVRLWLPSSEDICSMKKRGSSCEHGIQTRTPDDAALRPSLNVGQSQDVKGRRCMTTPSPFAHSAVPLRGHIVAGGQRGQLEEYLCLDSSPPNKMNHVRFLAGSSIFSHTGTVKDVVSDVWVISGHSRFPALAFFRYSTSSPHFALNKAQYSQGVRQTGEYGALYADPVKSAGPGSVSRIYCTALRIKRLIPLNPAAPTSFPIRDRIILVDKEFFQNYQEYSKRDTSLFNRIVSTVLFCAILQGGFEIGIVGSTDWKISITVICFNIYHLSVVTLSLNYTYCILQVKSRLEMLNMKIRELYNTPSFSNTGDIHNRFNPLSRHSIPTQLETALGIQGNLRHGTLHHRPINSAMEIFHLRVFYEKLCKCIFLINDAYGLQALSVLLSCLVVITNGIHLGIFLNSPVHTAPGSYLFSYLSRSLLLTLEIAFIISSCRYAHLEVRNSMDILQDLLLEMPVDGDVDEQLNMFHDQISSQIYLSAQQALDMCLISEDPENIRQEVENLVSNSCLLQMRAVGIIRRPVRCCKFEEKEEIQITAEEEFERCRRVVVNETSNKNNAAVATVLWFFLGAAHGANSEYTDTDHLRIQRCSIHLFCELQPHTPVNWPHWLTLCRNVVRHSAPVITNRPTAFRPILDISQAHRGGGAFSQHPLIYEPPFAFFLPADPCMDSNSQTPNTAPRLAQSRPQRDYPGRICYSPPSPSFLGTKGRPYLVAMDGMGGAVWEIQNASVSWFRRCQRDAVVVLQQWCAFGSNNACFKQLLHCYTSEDSGRLVQGSRSGDFQHVAVVIFACCQSAHLEVRNAMDIIQDLLIEVPVDGDVAEQLKMFHDQISSRDLSFSAGVGDLHHRHTSALGSYGTSGRGGDWHRCTLLWIKAPQYRYGTFTTNTPWHKAPTEPIRVTLATGTPSITPVHTSLVADHNRHVHVYSSFGTTDGVPCHNQTPKSHFADSKLQNSTPRSPQLPLRDGGGGGGWLRGGEEGRAQKYILPPTLKEIVRKMCLSGRFECVKQINTVTAARPFPDKSSDITPGKLIRPVQFQFNRNSPIYHGAAAAERLPRSPPAKANRVQSPAGSPEFRKWESCRTMPFFGGFSRGSPVFLAPSFRRCSIFTSITLIGFLDLAVKSHPNLFTHSLQLTTIFKAMPSQHHPGEIWGETKVKRNQDGWTGNRNRDFPCSNTLGTRKSRSGVGIGRGGVVAVTCTVVARSSREGRRMIQFGSPG